MDKSAVIEKVKKELHDLDRTLQSLSHEQFFNRKFEGKWTVAENVHHLVLAVRPLNLAFSLPLFAVRLFGKPNRPSRSFDEVVKRYQQRLNEGAKASGPFIPPKKINKTNEELMTVLKKTYSVFIEKVNMVSEEKWDKYLLPHPILGKITFREMIYFTAYHIHHHHLIIKERV